MVHLMLTATNHIQTPAPATLYHRFVRWTLPKATTCRVCGKRGHDVLPGFPPRLFPCDKLHEGVRKLGHTLGTDTR
jgi:hypothetical protein